MHGDKGKEWPPTQTKSFCRRCCLGRTGSTQTCYGVDVTTSHKNVTQENLAFFSFYLSFIFYLLSFRDLKLLCSWLDVTKIALGINVGRKMYILKYLEVNVGVHLLKRGVWKT